MLLIAHPNLKQVDGPVRTRLLAANVDAETMRTWEGLAQLDLTPPDEDAGY
ncbi:MAG TPA: hypothetical protein VGR35_04260 [Tepidisphaeraceae bacterium]|nr:hypothetical protein [Tepidisphaeraceae bacterium]